MNTALEYSTRVVQEGAIDVKRVLLTLCVCLYLYFNLLGNLAPCGAITEIAHRRMEEWQKKIHRRRVFFLNSRLMLELSEIVIVPECEFCSDCVLKGTIS
jgi:hypothetical protein